MSESENTQPPIPCLAVKKHGETTWFDLESNGSVLIGSGGHCRIQLETDGVKSLHCIVALKDGVMELRDWNTGTTLVNGVAVTEPVTLQHGDRIRIFGHEIEAVLAREPQSTEQETQADSVVDEESSPEEIQPEQTPPEQIQVEFAQPEVVFAQQNVPVVQGVEPTAQDEPVELGSSPSVEAQVPMHEPVESVQQEEAPSQFEGPQDVGVENQIQDNPQLDSPSVDTVQESQPVGVAADVAADVELGMVDPAESVESLTQPTALQQETVQPNVAETPVKASATTTDQSAEERTDQVPSQGSEGFVYDVLANLNDETDQAQFDVDAPGLTSTEMEDLRIENERLKKELAQRASEPVAHPTPPAPQQEAEALSREQTLSMITRMQELVAALKNADQRNHELEEALRVATAEQANPQPPAGSVPIELVMQMRDQVQALQLKLQDTLAEVNTLREQVSSSESSDDGADLEAAKKELADMRSEVSQEREAIAQQKVELDNLRAELRTRLEMSHEIGVADRKAEAPEDSVQVATAEAQDEETAIANQIASLIQRVSGDQ